MQASQTTPQPTPADWRPTTRPDGFNHPINPEPRDPEFHAFRESLFAEFAPQTCYEFDLVEDIINQRWGLKLNQQREADLKLVNRTIAKMDFERVISWPKGADFPELRKIAEIAGDARRRERYLRERDQKDHPDYQGAVQALEYCLDEYLRLSGNASPVSAREIRSRESQLRRSLQGTLSELRRTRRERCHLLQVEQRQWKDAKNKEYFEAKAQAPSGIVANCEITEADSEISLPVSASSELGTGPEPGAITPREPLVECAVEVVVSEEVAIQVPGEFVAVESPAAMRTDAGWALSRGSKRSRLAPTGRGSSSPTNTGEPDLGGGSRLSERLLRLAQVARPRDPNGIWTGDRLRWMV